jgi:hypothetical protein
MLGDGVVFEPFACLTGRSAPDQHPGTHDRSHRASR